MYDPEICKGCSLNKLSGAHKLVFEPNGAPVLIVTQSPSPEENEQEELLTRLSPHGKFMWQALHAVGIEPDDCDVTAAVKCIPAEPVKGSYSSYLRPRAPSAKEIKICSTYTKQFVQLATETKKLRAILVLGQVAAKQLLGGEWRKEKRIVDSAKLGVRCFLVDHPGFFLRAGIRGINEGDERLKSFRQTLRAMAEFIGTDSKVLTSREFLETQKYVMANTVTDAKFYAERLRKWSVTRGERLTVDVEDDVPDDFSETGTESTDPMILSVSICPKPGYSVMFVVDHPEHTPRERNGIVAALKELLENPKIGIAMHYGASDAYKLKALLNIKTPGYDLDTFTSMYLAQVGRFSYGINNLVDEHAPQFSGYKYIIAPYVGPKDLEVPKAAQKSDEALYNFIKRKSVMHFSQIPLRVLNLYNNADADVTKRFEMMSRLQAPAALQKIYADMGHLVYRMESHGPLVDYAHIERLKKVWPPLVARGAAKLREVAAQFTKHPEKFNPNAWEDVSWLLWEKLQIPYPVKNAKKYSTEKEVLLQIAPEYPIARDVIEYRKLAKTKSTYITGYENCANINGGRLRTKWWLCMPAGELVLTNRGYIPVETVCTDDLVLTHTGKAQKVTETVVNGMQPLIRVTLSNGMTLRTTPNHPYLIRVGGHKDWKEAGQLKTGMHAVVYGHKEKWAPTKHAGYEVSTWGRVRHKKHKNVLSHVNGGDGRLQVNFNGVTHRVHKLVARAFLHKSAELVRHKNGYDWDNTVQNLAWGTIQENITDKMLHGTTYKCNLTAEDVKQIQNQQRRYGVQTALAEYYGVSRETVKDIMNDRYRHHTPIGKHACVKFKSATIIKIEHLPAEMTYGLTVEHDHSHITNGIVTHNTGTRTGRLSSGGSKEKIKGVVNLQNIQKNPHIRNILVSDLRWRELYGLLGNLIATNCTDEEIEEYVLRDYGNMTVFLEFDQGQVEVRTAGQVSGDKQMIHDCEAGDIHSQVGHVMTGWSIDKIQNDKDTRTRTKNVHFGVLFGLDPEGVLRYIRGFDPNTKITLDEVTLYYNNYFDRYPGMAVYIDKQHAYAAEHGCVYTIFGMRRPILINEQMKGLVDDYGQPAYWKNISVNTPIQGSAHQLLMCGLVQLIRQPKKYKLLGTPHMEVHDNLVMGVKLRDLVTCYWLAKELLEQETVRTVKSDFADRVKWRVKLEVDGAAGFRFGVKVGLKDNVKIGTFLRQWYEANVQYNVEFKALRKTAIIQAV